MNNVLSFDEWRESNLMTEEIVTSNTSSWLYKGKTRKDHIFNLIPMGRNKVGITAQVTEDTEKGTVKITLSPKIHVDNIFGKKDYVWLIPATLELIENIKKMNDIKAVKVSVDGQDFDLSVVDKIKSIGKKISNTFKSFSLDMGNLKVTM
jgi:hypothetical protein